MPRPSLSLSLHSQRSPKKRTSVSFQRIDDVVTRAVTFIIVLACGPGSLCVRICICVCVGVTRSPGDTHVPSLFFSACPIYFSGVLNRGILLETLGIGYRGRKKSGNRSMNLLFASGDARKVSGWREILPAGSISKGKALNRRLNIFESIVNCCFPSRGSL